MSVEEPKNQLLNNIDLTFYDLLGTLSPDDIAKCSDLSHGPKKLILKLYGPIISKLFTHILFTEHPTEEVFKTFILDSQIVATNVIDIMKTSLNAIRGIEVNKKEHIKNGTSIDE